MTRAQAIVRLRRLINGKLYIRVEDEISSPAKRDAAKQQRLAIAQDIAALDNRIAEKMREAGIVALQEQRRALRKQADDMAYRQSAYRFCAGIDRGWCSEIKATGDTWEEVIQKLQDKNEQSA